MKKLRTALYLIVFAGLAAVACRQSVTVARETSNPCQSDSDCDDDKPCTQDSCLATKHCSHKDLTGPCDDGDDCTVNDQCQDGSCVGQPEDLDQDGFGSSACGGEDCLDTEPSVNPDGVEGVTGDINCHNSFDDDCDGQADMNDLDCNPVLCNAHGWCWQFPRPQGNTLNAVLSFESGEAWAVGEAGTLLYFDGDVWELLDSGTESDLNDIAGTGPDDIWSAGKQGTFLHWNGSRWQSMPSSTSIDLQGLFVDSAKNAWTVGRAGFLGRWSFQDDKLQHIASPSNKDLYAIWGAAEDRIWAVGQSGTLLEWDGLQWSSLNELPTNANFYDIWGSDSNDIWVVGDREFYHKEGSTWQSQPPNSAGLVYAIHGSSPANVRAIGIDGFTWHWNGSEWSLELESGGSDFKDISVPRQSWFWSVGARGVIFLRILSGWYRMATKVLESLSFSAACFNSEDDIWIASNSFSSMQHFDGKNLGNFYPDENMRVSDLACFGSNNVWAVGPQGGFLRWQGQSWTKTSGPSTGNLTGLWGIQDNIWAVGGNGTLLHWLESRGSWVELDVPSDQDLKGIFGTAPDDIWVVGSTGTLLHYNGIQWNNVTSPSEVNLNGVWAVSKNDAWIIDASGKIFRWNGSDWQLQFDSGIEQKAISGLGPNDVWTAGLDGSVFHFDGDKWQRVPSGCANDLLEILVMPSKIMVFGQGSSMLVFAK